MSGIRRVAVTAALAPLIALHAAAQQPPAQPALSARSMMPRLLAPRSDALALIQGNTLTSTNGQLPNTLVRLRDARFGEIVDSQVTDTTGLFTFRAVDPGSYIVEMLAPDRTVLAASQLLSVNAGEAISAVVKLPFRVSPYAGLLGSTAPSAAVITSEAAASAVMTMTTAGSPTCAGS